MSPGRGSSRLQNPRLHRTGLLPVLRTNRFSPSPWWQAKRTTRPRAQKGGGRGPCFPTLGVKILPSKPVYSPQVREAGRCDGPDRRPAGHRSALPLSVGFREQTRQLRESSQNRPLFPQDADDSLWTLWLEECLRVPLEGLFILFTYLLKRWPSPVKEFWVFQELGSDPPGSSADPTVGSFSSPVN